MTAIARPSEPLRQRHIELATFLLLTVVVVPAITIAGIGGYGLLIWLAQ